MRRLMALFLTVPLLAFGLATTLAVTASPAGAEAGPAATVFINEIHYDNDGGDVGEFVEIAGTAGTDLTGWSLVLYNGSASVRAPYDTIDLSAQVIDDEGTGTGAFAVTFPSNGIQNGAPDGLALVDNGTVVQFLSYEGSFEALSGPAAGLTSTDIGVAETSSTPIGQSLQLSGTGSTAGDFTWGGPTLATPGDLNAGQTVDPTDPVDPGGDGGLVISQYIEGSGFNKVLELENRGDSPIDLTQLTVELYSNGSATPTTTFDTAGGTLAVGDVYVIANASADAAVLSVADVTSGVANWNGDDAIAVRVDGTIVDVFGTIGDDPGSAWVGGSVSTQNQSLCRDAAITEGDTDGFTDPSIEYTSAPIDTFDGLGVADCVTPIAPTGACGAGTAFIHEIQGDGAASPCVGDAVTVTGVVTGLFERDDALDAFFLQEEDADADADPNTSEGIFVFCREDCPTVAPGDQVTVSGDVVEFFGMTQIDAAFGNGTFVIDSTGNPLPTPVVLTLPAGTSTLDEATYETVEGMLVSFSDTLVVSEYFQLARFGQLVLTDEARPYQFTHTDAPDEAGYQAFLADLATRRIILDDDNNDQNDAISDGPDEAYYQAGGGLTTTNVVRGGDTIEDLTGVMHWSFAGSSNTDAWRLRPVPQQFDYSFTQANPRPADPAPTGGSLEVASFNVLNLFTTIDDGSNSGCGPTGALGCRGAHSAAEFQRQLDKIVAALFEMDAEIVGLIEIENNADASLQAVVDALNAVAGAGTYDYIDTGTIGGDAIKVGLIYQPDLVTPVGDFAILDSAVDARFIDDKNRPMLTQTFDENATGARFTVSVNHLKSKGSGCGVGDDATDGSGNCDGTRTAAAEAIVDFLAGDPTGSGDPDHLVIGDLNAYKMERPITTLTDAGYVDLIESFEGPDAYSFVFDGQLGYLDHALANAAMAPQVTGVSEWHINADEVNVYDYNDDVEDPGEAFFERISETPPTYSPDAFRSSDHDPVIVGLDLTAPVTEVGCQSSVGELEAAGFNVVQGTSGGELIFGTNGPDAILAGGGNDVVVSLGGDDLVCGDAGNDYVIAGGGADRIVTGAGNDLVLAGSGDDDINGGAGFDLAVGGRGTDRCVDVEFTDCEEKVFLP